MENPLVDEWFEQSTDLDENIRMLHDQELDHEDDTTFWSGGLNENQENVPVSRSEAASPVDPSLFRISTSRRSLGQEDHKQACLPARLHSQHARSPIISELRRDRPLSLQRSIQGSHKKVFSVPKRTEDVVINRLALEATEPESRSFTAMHDSGAQDSIVNRNRTSQSVDRHASDCEQETSQMISDVCCLLEEKIQRIAKEARQSRPSSGEDGAGSQLGHGHSQEAHLRNCLVKLLDEALQADGAEEKEPTPGYGRSSPVQSHPVSAIDRLGNEEMDRFVQDAGPKEAQNQLTRLSDLSSDRRQLLERTSGVGPEGRIATIGNQLSGEQISSITSGQPKDQEDESEAWPEKVRKSNFTDSADVSAKEIRVRVKQGQILSESGTTSREQETKASENCYSGPADHLKRPQVVSRATIESANAYQVAFFRAQGEYLAWQQIRQDARSEVEQVWARKKYFEAKERFHSIQTAVLNLKVSRQQATELKLALCLQVGVSLPCPFSDGSPFD
jgi:hypothetical protein